MARRRVIRDFYEVSKCGGVCCFLSDICQTYGGCIRPIAKQAFRIREGRRTLAIDIRVFSEAILHPFELFYTVDTLGFFL